MLPSTPSELLGWRGAGSVPRRCKAAGYRIQPTQILAEKPGKAAAHRHGALGVRLGHQGAQRGDTGEEGGVSGGQHVHHLALADQHQLVAQLDLRGGADTKGQGWRSGLYR